MYFNKLLNFIIYEISLGEKLKLLIDKKKIYIYFFKNNIQNLYIASHLQQNGFYFTKSRINLFYIYICTLLSLLFFL